MMLSPVVFALLVVAAGVAAFLVGWIAHKRVGEGKVFNAEQLAAKIVRDAEREAETQKKSALL